MVIYCSKCDQDLPIESFAPSQRQNGAWCRACRSAYMKAYPKRYTPSAEVERPCLMCGVMFLRWEAWPHPGAAARRCHPCYLEYVRKRMSPTAKPRRPEGPRPQDKVYKLLRQQVFDEETHCGICGEWVDPNLPSIDKMGRTVDHITPLAAGGAKRDRANLRLAHRSCNSKVGNDWRKYEREALRERAQLLGAALWLNEQLAG